MWWDSGGMLVVGSCLIMLQCVLNTHDVSSIVSCFYTAKILPEDNTISTVSMIIITLRQ